MAAPGQRQAPLLPDPQWATDLLSARQDSPARQETPLLAAVLSPPPYVRQTPAPTARLTLRPAKAVNPAQALNMYVRNHPTADLPPAATASTEAAAITAAAPAGAPLAATTTAAHPREAPLLQEAAAAATAARHPQGAAAEAAIAARHRLEAVAAATAAAEVEEEAAAEEGKTIFSF